MEMTEYIEFGSKKIVVRKSEVGMDNTANTIVSAVDLIKNDINTINDKLTKMSRMNKRKCWINPRRYKRSGNSKYR